MTFDKDKYWERRNNTVEVEDPKTKEKTLVATPLRGQGDKIRPKVSSITDGAAEIGFGNDGTMVVKNRAFRRKPTRLPTKEVKIIPRRKAEYEKKRQKRIRVNARKERLAKV